MTHRLVRVTGTHSGPSTGAAIVQREIVSRLSRHLPPSVIISSEQRTEGLARRVLGHPFEEVADVLITTSTPLPLFVRARCVVPLVHDVRWKWTRSVPARMYRYLDAVQTGRRAAHALTVSHTVADQLRALRFIPDGGITVLRLGPGQFQDIEPAPVDDRRDAIVLVGGAAHKRNEEAATLLAGIPSVRSGMRIIGVSVSDRTIEILREAFPSDRLDFRSGLSVEQLAATFAEAKAYIALGTSEGFGLPYIEAAHQGCDVIAVEQALTWEILGDDAHLLRSDPTTNELEAALDGWDAERVGRLQGRALARDWDDAAAQIAEQISRLPA